MCLRDRDGRLWGRVHLACDTVNEHSEVPRRLWLVLSATVWW